MPIYKLKTEFADFYELNYGLALQYVMVRMVGHTNQEDIVQETFSLAWEKTMQKQKICKRGWLFKVLRNKIGDAYRSKAVRDAQACHIIDPVLITGTDQDDVIDIIETRRALGKLSDKCREALLLVYGCGLNTDEAAQAVGCGHSTLRKRLSRAREEFKNIYSGSAIEPQIGVEPQQESKGK